MLNPGDPTTGRGLLLFAGLMLGLGLFVGLRQAAWWDAAFWLSLAGFMAFYGALLLDVLPQLQRLLLVLGLASGGLALVLALRMTIVG